MTARACDNCGTSLAGEYCHGCGQRALTGDELTVRHALTVVSHDLLHLESKTLRSMALLLRPGLLTAKYLEGHRAPYTSPIKLYLACAAIFFLLAPYAGFSLDQILSQPSSRDLATVVNRELAGRNIDRALFFERFDLRFQTVYTIILFASAMASAGMLALLFRRQRRPFGAHVVYGLHYVSFLYLITIVLGWVLRLLPPWPAGGLVLTLVFLSTYQFFALRRVYGEPVRQLWWKVAVMIVFALVFDSIISFLALFITMKLI